MLQVKFGKKHHRCFSITSKGVTERTSTTIREIFTMICTANHQRLVKLVCRAKLQASNIFMINVDLKQTSPSQASISFTFFLFFRARTQNVGSSTRVLLLDCH